ncbi:hypothetical protein V8C35DRAFT_328611 [Trichoderma chlorosporum]
MSTAVSPSTAMSTNDSIGRAFIRAFFSFFDSLSDFGQRPLPIARIICASTEFFYDDDEPISSTLRVTRNEGIVVKIRQLILMKVRFINNMRQLVLQEMHTTTLLVETYPEGDEIGEPIEEED